MSRMRLRRLATRSLHALRRELSRRPVHRSLHRRATPPVLLTTVPKCGTNILRELFRDIPGLNYLQEMRRNDQTEPAELDAALSRAEGMWVVGHIPYSDGIAEAVAARSARVVFAFRDPRAYVISLAHHIHRFDTHVMHEHFRANLQDMEDSIEAVIRGVHLGVGRFLPDVATYFRRFDGWRSFPAAYTTTFEEIVGPKGGGDLESQRRAVDDILRHVGFEPLSPRAVELLADLMFYTASPTFRRGRIDDWKERFTPRLKAAFKETAGDLLVDLGYETDDSW